MGSYWACSQAYNSRRCAEAAAATVPLVAQFLASPASAVATPLQRQAAELRIQHPDLPLSQLGKLAGCAFDVYASRLRRFIAHAQRAHQAGYMGAPMLDGQIVLPSPESVTELLNTLDPDKRAAALTQLAAALDALQIQTLGLRADTMLELKQRGLTWEAIARRFKVSVAAAWHCARRYRTDGRAGQLGDQLALDDRRRLAHRLPDRLEAAA